MAYAALQERKNELIRKGLQGSVFIAPSTAAAIAPSSLFDSTTGDLKALPAGYVDLGWLTDVGVKAGRAIKTNDIMGWGSNDPLRSDISSDSTTVVVECQETKIETIALYIGVDPLSLVPDPTNGTLTVVQPNVNTALRYRCLIVSVDSSLAGEVVVARFLPSVGVTNINDQVFANQAASTTWGVTLTAYVDSTLNYAQEYLFGGAGWLAQVGDAEVPRVVTVTTNSTTLLVATAGTFSTYDVGRSVSGAGIPAGAKIATFTDATHVVLSVAATASASGVALTVT